MVFATLKPVIIGYRVIEGLYIYIVDTPAKEGHIHGYTVAKHLYIGTNKLLSCDFCTFVQIHSIQFNKPLIRGHLLTREKKYT